MQALFLSLHWSWKVTLRRKEAAVNNSFRFSLGSGLIVRNHYLIGTFVPFSHNVLSSYISLHGAYLPFSCPLIWPSYFLSQLILMPHYVTAQKSFVEVFYCSRHFPPQIITILSKIDPELIPRIYTFPYIKVSLPPSLPLPFFLFPCLPLSANIYWILILCQKLL